MELIKVDTDHFVVVNKTIQPVNGYYYDSFINKIKSTNGAEYGEASHCWQITHSNIGHLYQDSILPLSLQEVKELIGEVDKAKEYAKNKYGEGYYPDVEMAYNQALEDNKEKRYTEEDLKKMFDMGEGLSSMSDTDDNKFKYALKHIQPKTSWQVEIVDGKLKLK